MPHDQLTAQVHLHLVQHYGSQGRFSAEQVKERNHFGTVPPAVLQGAQLELLWDPYVRTPNAVGGGNRPDMLLVDHLVKRVMIFETTVCQYEHLLDRQVSKAAKYGQGSHAQKGNTLMTELARKYHKYIVEVVPIVMGTCGEVPKGDWTIETWWKIHAGGRRWKTLLSSMIRSVCLSSARILRLHLGSK